MNLQSADGKEFRLDVDRSELTAIVRAMETTIVAIEEWEFHSRIGIHRTRATEIFTSLRHSFSEWERGTKTNADHWEGQLIPDETEFKAHRGAGEIRLEPADGDHLHLLVSDDELNIIISSLGESLEALGNKEVISTLGLDRQTVMATIVQLRRQQHEFERDSGP